ncbi:MAG TPA: 6-bladed beta-propeller [Candidatus Eisenbacteria bacterium]|nr:6-bladed beta-propeller [Candidatus Eisenbacteria bacterium]
MRLVRRLSPINRRYLVTSLSLLALAISAGASAETPPVFERKWGTHEGLPGSEPGFLWNAGGLAANASNQIFVADNQNQRVQKFSALGTPLASWPAGMPPPSGSGDGQLAQPAGVDLDASGNVYVADSGNHRIQKFSSGGIFIAKWGTQGSGNGQFRFPLDVTVDEDGFIYVADTDNYRVQKLSASGSFVTSWGDSGSGTGQFRQPVAIDVDPVSGDVFVSDLFRRNVQRFHADGTFVEIFVPTGSGPGQTNGPWGLEFDPSGNLYLVDRGGSRVEKFNNSGTLLSQWGGDGQGDGQFRSPQGITVAADGSVYVSDIYHGIQRFVYNVPATPITWGRLKQWFP